jgi:hypothetical protein
LLLSPLHLSRSSQWSTKFSELIFRVVLTRISASVEIRDEW